MYTSLALRITPERTPPTFQCLKYFEATQPLRESNRKFKGVNPSCFIGDVIVVVAIFEVLFLTEVPQAKLEARAVVVVGGDFAIVDLQYLLHDGKAYAGIPRLSLEERNE